jgi:hypothetical protein
LTGASDSDDNDGGELPFELRRVSSGASLASTAEGAMQERRANTLSRRQTLGLGGGRRRRSSVEVVVDSGGNAQARRLGALAGCSAWSAM